MKLLRNDNLSVNEHNFEKKKLSTIAFEVKWETFS
jgi:hypothetical protein